MQATVLSSKGQVIIPKALRMARRWGPGTRLEVFDTPDGVLFRPVVQTDKVALASGLAAIRQRVAYHGPVVSLAAMDAAVLREAAQRAPVPAPRGKAAVGVLWMPVKGAQRAPVPAPRGKTLRGT